VIDQIGIEVKCNTQVGKDVSIESLSQSYDAIFIAGGITGGVLSCALLKA
jgi:NADPH-dependent glutamate synthase beta subunit-like oxidoreductase